MKKRSAPADAIEANFASYSDGTGGAVKQNTTDAFVIYPNLNATAGFIYYPAKEKTTHCYI